jgi:tetratricopeptide (TPR) repeat protein
VAGKDEVMDRIGAAIALSQRGERAAARQEFERIWAEISTGGEPFHRCVLAHYLADLQDDPRAELTWDLRALEAAGSVTDERAREHHSSLRIRGFYPSLHLNLAEDYRRLGKPDQAREHLAEAERTSPALDDDGYGNGIRAAIMRLADRLEETTN